MHALPATVAVDIGENGLSFVVFGTVAFSIVMSVLFVVTRGSDSMYDQIGHGGLSSEGESRPDGYRVIIELPLTAYFQVIPDDCIVKVLRVIG